MGNRIARLGFVVALVTACGSDAADPQEACNQMINSFASAWSRCGVTTYDAAKQVWTQAFGGCSPSNADQSKIDQCSNDLNTADCNLIKNRASPASCKDVLK